MKYVPVYKCQICGQLIRLQEEIDCNDLKECFDMIQKIRSHQKYLPSCTTSDEIAHYCKNGSVGIATFAGLYKL